MSQTKGSAARPSRRSADNFLPPPRGARRRSQPGRTPLPALAEGKRGAVQAAAAAAQAAPSSPEHPTPSPAARPSAAAGLAQAAPAPLGCQRAPTPRRAPAAGAAEGARARPLRRPPPARAPRRSGPLTALRRMPPCVFAAIFCAAARTGVWSARASAWPTPGGRRALGPGPRPLAAWGAGAGGDGKAVAARRGQAPGRGVAEDGGGPLGLNGQRGCPLSGHSRGVQRSGSTSCHAAVFPSVHAAGINVFNIGSVIGR